MTPREITAQVITAMEQQDWPTVDRLLAGGCRFSGPVPDELGKEDFMGLQRAVAAALPDWRFNPHDWVEEGDAVAVTFDITGTHDGTLDLPALGLAPVRPTGTRVSLPGERMRARVRNGRITSIHVDVPPGGGVPGLLAQVQAAVG